MSALRFKFWMVVVACLILIGCGGSSNQGDCEKDGDCPATFRCDIYAKICRCTDKSCDTAAGERCDTDGTCKLKLGCTTDQECGGCKRCDTATGECLCTENCGCPDGQVCNASGYCQPSSGCFDNLDCASGEICDTPTKTCIPATSCTNKFQCPIAKICTGGVCVDGCEDYGDCPLHWGCVSGRCAEGVCQEDDFCEFREYCNNGTCTDGYNAQYSPYCKACDGSSLDGCGQRANPCLIYPYTADPFANAGNDEYCGVDCSGGQRCPNGFECSSIITIKQSDLCTSSSQCPGGLPCLKSAEEDQGFCPCHDTSNPCMANTCLQDSCNTWTNKCLALGMAGIDLPCTRNEDCWLCDVTMNTCTTNADCRTIQCEKYDGVDYGGCVSAKACGLKEGFHCPL